MPTKISKYGSIIILAAISILFIAVLPTLISYKYLERVSNQSIETFLITGTEADTIFSGPFADRWTKTGKGFDIDRLRNLGQDLSINLESTIKHIQEPQGSFWITVALGETVTALVKRMVQTNFQGNLKSRIIYVLLSFFGFVITIVAFCVVRPFRSLKNYKGTESPEKMKGKTGKVLSLVSFIVVNLVAVFGLLYIIIHSIPKLIYILFKSTEIKYFELDPTVSFSLLSIVYVVVLIFFVYIVYRLIRPYSSISRRAFAVVCLIPIISLAFSIHFASTQVDVFNSMIHTQMINTNRQMVIYDCSRIVAGARQWYRQTDEEGIASWDLLSFFMLPVPPENEHGSYSFSWDEELLTITGIGKIKDKEEKYTNISCTYNAEIDSVKIVINPDTKLEEPKLEEPEE